MKLIVITFIFSVVNSNPVPTEEHEESSNYHYKHPYVLIESLPGKYLKQNLSGTLQYPHVNESDIGIIFYSRSHSKLGTRLQLKDTVLTENTNFDQYKDTVLLIHGWMNNIRSPFCFKVKEALLSARDINVLVVDWSKLARHNYLSAKHAVVGTGYHIGEYLKSLVKHSDLDLTRTRIVGYSLGAHIAGIAGAAVDGKLDHIVGLDPAWPLFYLKKVKNRLNKNDANYVQVIHTCAVLGFPVSIGHADFYPNGGKRQPGCRFLSLRGICSHSRSYHYYAESLSSGYFMATRCNTYKDYKKGKCTNSTSTYMGGYFLDKRAFGNYYLKTNSKYPYGNAVGVL